MQQNMDGKKEREERKKLAIDHEEEKSTLITRSARAQHEISIAQWLKNTRPSYVQRLRLAFNLAELCQVWHMTGKTAQGDLSGENFRVATAAGGATIRAINVDLKEGRQSKETLHSQQAMDVFALGILYQTILAEEEILFKKMCHANKQYRPSLADVLLDFKEKM
jgi:hypothetical protein